MDENMQKILDSVSTFMQDVDSLSDKIERTLKSAVVPLNFKMNLLNIVGSKVYRKVFTEKITPQSLVELLELPVHNIGYFNKFGFYEIQGAFDEIPDEFKVPFYEDIVEVSLADLYFSSADSKLVDDFIEKLLLRGYTAIGY